MIQRSINVMCAAIALIVFVSIIDAQTPDFKKRQFLLDLHNSYRASMTRNTYGDQPIATNMTAMDWDDQLYTKAMEIASTCSVNIPEKYEQLGRVIIMESLNLTYSNEKHFRILFKRWFDDSISKNFDCLKNQSSCSNVRQILHSRADRVGCTENPCGANLTLLVCLYNFRPISEGDLFSTGNSLSEVCTKCPRHKPFCLDGSLCASHDNCDKKSIFSHCKCSILRKICELNGILDSTNCICKCKLSYRGINCEDQLHNNKDDSTIDTIMARLKSQHPGNTRTTNYQIMSKVTKLTDIMEKSISTHPKSSTPTTYQQQCGELLPLMKNLIKLLHFYKDNLSTSTTAKFSTSASSRSSGSSGASGASGSSVSSTPMEPTQCPNIMDLCSLPVVSSLCKRTCATLNTSKSSATGSSISSTSGISTISTPTSNVKEFCSSIKHLCHNAIVYKICKETCANCKENDRRKAICKMVKNNGLCKEKVMISMCPTTCGYC